MTNYVDQRGVALVAVLWLVTLLTVLATASVTISVGRARVIRAAMEYERASILADSAIRLTLAELASTQSTRPTSGPPGTMELFGESVEVEVGVESERLNVNTANRIELQSLFEQRGSEGAADLGTRIEQWRSLDSQRLVASEHGGYGGTNSANSARRGPFESPEEVRQLPGLDGDDRGWLDSLTVYGPSRTPRSSIAQPTPGDIFRVHACIQTLYGPACRTAVVRLTGNNRDPLQTFLWR